MLPLRNAVLGFLGALALGSRLSTPVPAEAPANAVEDGSALSSAICPIVYPLDQSPSDRGFHYTFYGNGFFINKEGYLLTAAHVLSQLNDSPPYIVLRLPMAPPRFLKTEVVAMDRDHDVALLRATPNPFEGKYQVRFLPLAVHRPARTQSVLAAALRPSRLRDPHTFDAFVEDRPAGEVLSYEFSQLDRGRAETELLLFSHEVLLGDSGAPVVSGESQVVVGLVEGRWLRVNAASLAIAAKLSGGGVGAAVPIHYAIPLLQQHGVHWQPAEDDTEKNVPLKALPGTSDMPVPLSLVAAPAPAQALQGGEVVLDAQVNREGQLADITVVQGSSPFVEKTLSAVHTWSFQPSPPGQETHRKRLGIVFQFASPGASPGDAKGRRYDPPDVEASERAALPILTTEPSIAAKSQTEATVILAARIDANGEATGLEVLRDSESLAPGVVRAVRQWQFIPGQSVGANCDSAMIIVFVPRLRPAPSHAQSNGHLHPSLQ
jgi:TonB family protein